MLLPADAFADKEVECIYIAARRSEAKRVEDVLTSRGIDYVVDIEPFEAMILGIFRTERDGVGFYVESRDGERSREGLREARLLQGLVERDPE